MRDQLLLVRAARLQLPDLAPLAQHDRTVGELDHVFHVVGDEDHRVALGAQLRDQVEDLARLAHAERGRRLVEDHHLAREHRRARHGDRLALAARHQGHRRIELRQLDLEAVEHRRGLAVHGAAVEEPSPRGSQAGKAISRPQ